jgi:hypothetical protein
MERNSHMRPTFKGTFKGVFKGSFRGKFKGSSHVRPSSCSSLSLSPCFLFLFQFLLVTQSLCTS